MQTHTGKAKTEKQEEIYHKYRAIAVVPNKQSYQNSTEYFNKKVKILRYTELEKFVTTSLEKVPNKGTLSNRKSQGGQEPYPKNLSRIQFLNAPPQRRGEKDPFTAN